MLAEMGQQLNKRVCELFDVQKVIPMYDKYLGKN